jgi:hypothetical protein
VCTRLRGHVTRRRWAALVLSVGSLFFFVFVFFLVLFFPFENEDELSGEMVRVVKTYDHDTRARHAGMCTPKPTREYHVG